MAAGQLRNPKTIANPGGLDSADPGHAAAVVWVQTRECCKYVSHLKRLLTPRRDLGKLQALEQRRLQVLFL